MDVEQLIKRLRNAATLSDQEKQFVEEIVSLVGEEVERPVKAGHRSEEEARAAAIGDWLIHQLEHGDRYDEMPAALGTFPALFSRRIPLLLAADFAGQPGYSEIKKFMGSYFGHDTLVIPLPHKEWVILAPESALTEGQEEGEGEQDEESVLESIAYGLHSLIYEWYGACHITIEYPIVPSKTLPATVAELREFNRLGRNRALTQYIHAPWMLRLEQLLDPLPDEDKKYFIETVIRRVDTLDAELLSTLETFFELDCNVSDTAKQLYIHRNTLLYRLDKFKTETGLDVRRFNQAVLVKLAIHLYKITKRA